MNIFDFQKAFPSEKDCKVHFRKFREHEGIKCKKCSSSSHYWLQGKEVWQCKNCSFRTSLKSGTILQHSKLPFLTWYKAVMLIVLSKKGVSNKAAQRILGCKRYEPVWYMLQKIRKSLCEIRDDAFFDSLKGRVVESHWSACRTNKNLFNQKLVVEGEGKYDDNIYNVSFRPFFNEVPRKYYAFRQISWFKDRSFRFPNIARYYSQRWLNKIQDNFDRKIRGIHHHVSNHYYSFYYNEFCFSYNHRHNQDALFYEVLKRIRYPCGVQADNQEYVRRFFIRN